MCYLVVPIALPRGAEVPIALPTDCVVPTGADRVASWCRPVPIALQRCLVVPTGELVLTVVLVVVLQGP